ncbi:arginyl-tRNA synthetase [Cantharellus anzutake]|uniref:arginyl-tRNA synthetase n=1 Tax=Cantharellus anzutake TaxID=1750568 RepID=UPI0019030E23|nr:arginyl-tRNA synthetase [Cantharellus anzutake]KAF8331282.1 arginyl-tRNA synthetase [Cantharellus anzutake]
MASSPTTSATPSTFSSTLPVLPGTYPERAPLDLFRTAVAIHINRVIPELSLEKIFDGVDILKKEGDFSVAMPRFRLPGVKPDVSAATVASSFQPDEYIETVKAVGPFLYFNARLSTFARIVLRTIDRETFRTLDGVPRYGTNDSGKGKKVLIEYSSPNIAKQFHIGHLRSTIIGQFLINLHKANGWETLSMNYLGDWGRQFGLIAVGFEKYGSQEELEKDAIKHLYDVYVKINNDASTDESVLDKAREHFRQMEDGGESALKQWRIWRDYSIEKYREEYGRLNVSFDVYSGESQVSLESQSAPLERLEKMGLISEEKGAKLVDLTQWKLEKAVVRKKDGTSIYLTRDIGAAIERYEKYKFDKMIYVVASQQDLHVAQFFKILSLLEYPWAGRLQHVNYGLVLGMSTRKGTAVFLDDIIREASEIMHEQMKKNPDKYSAVEDPEGTSREIGITAVKIQDMAAKRINNYNFNWSRMLSFEGDTGPYLQYAHVRLASMARKNPELLPLRTADPSDPKSSIDIDTDSLTEPKVREILMLLASYPDVVKTAMEKYEPSGVVTFCFRLSHAISSAWETLSVKGDTDRSRASARLWLFLSAKEVLGAAMRLLSLMPLERM